LARELGKGQSQFCKRDAELYRVVDFVVVLVVYEPEHLVIQEFARPANRRDFGGVLEKTMKERLLPGESMLECAQRCLDDKLGFATDGVVRVNADILQVRETKETFEEFYPGLPSLIRMFVVEANVVSADRDDLERLGILSKSLNVHGFTYQWEKIHEIRHVRKQLRAKWASLRVPRTSNKLRTSTVPIVPWTEGEVTRLLEEHSIADPVFAFGMKAKELDRALREGKVSLGVVMRDSVTGKAHGQLVCVTEQVSMIVAANDQVLVCSNSGSSSEDVSTPILPSTKKLSTESIWMVAVRLAQEHFKLSTPMLKMDGKVLSMIDSVGKTEDSITRRIVVLGPWLPCTGSLAAAAA